MPELPEVELHRRHLERWLVGRRVEDVTIRPAGLLPGATAPTLTRKLRGATFKTPFRRGKHVALPVEGGGALYLHLGMTGNLSRRASSDPVPRYQVLGLLLDDGNTVDLTDSRRFSKLGWITSEDLTAAAPFNALGPDLLLSPPTAAQLRSLLANTRRPIKIALMEQSLVAGLGNIHAQEALWRARIHPGRPANSLSTDELRRLLTGIRQTFELVLDDDDGETLAYINEGAENPFKVYDREGETCPRCRRAKIKKVVQGGRSTYLCPTCQRA